jgi:hypothetical protein
MRTEQAYPEMPLAYIHLLQYILYVAHTVKLQSTSIFIVAQYVIYKQFVAKSPYKKPEGSRRVTETS